MVSESKEKIIFLKNQATNIRIDSIRATTASNSGHPTSCLSAADIVSALFFHTMKYDPSNPQAINNDRFILSKGHAIPVVYAAWKHAGVISDKELMTLREFDSVLEGHPTPRFKYNEAATGSLGQGLAIGVGQALNARLDKLSYKTYVMIGDGESAEGSIWEAVALASHYKLNNLIGIIDCNRFGQSEETIHNHHVEIYKQKFEAFGWDALVIDGHNMEEIIGALNKESSKPIMIIAKTFKGHGLEVSNKNGFHGKPLKEDEANHAIEKLKNLLHETKINFNPNLPKAYPDQSKAVIKLPNIEFKKPLATRKAYGQALAQLGSQSKDVVTLDADVKNSTFTQNFEDQHSDRFFQCFIAEQCMVSVATGFELRGKIPFAATFGAFLSRAFDQIRMAGIGKNALRLCGSHCGVSIGEDGPSQMGLEDIAIIRTVPESIVLYPSDAVSTYRLVELMANYHDGISYIRTTRMDTPILYDNKDEFKIGGSKVVKKGTQACIIAAGITLHEALKAHAILEQKGISVTVIDLYSVKPIDTDTIKNESNGLILTVEDHYQAGGIGEAIKSAINDKNILIQSLFVKNVSRSGKPEELLAYAGIDSQSIVKSIESLI